MAADRHRPGYYEDYAKRTNKTDRHKPDYYKEYYRKKKELAAANSNMSIDKTDNTVNTNETSVVKTQSKSSNNKRKKKDRRAYFHKYNQEHPERLNRGYTKGYKNGNVADGFDFNDAVNDGILKILGYDCFGLPITNDKFGDMLRNHEMMWHDDDWCEEPD